MTALPTTEKFDRIYRSLLVADVRQDLGSFFPGSTFPDEEELAYALSVATRLALSGSGDTIENAHAGRQAYEVAIRCLNFANGSTPTVRAVSDLILSRIGNFPAQSLLRHQAGSANPTNDPFLELELLVRKFENSIRGTGSETTLTDFQVRLIRALETKRSVSVSAPTSAGKSFTLEIEVLRRLKDDDSYHAVFIVPTRALIRQVTFDLVKILRDHSLVAVSVLSAPTTPEDVAEIKKIIYVLTQERLATLLTAENENLKIDTIIVDEAHEIGDSNRGVTLERVLGMALVRFPAARLFFSSPLRSNPDFLLRLFGRLDDADYFVEHLSPVTQNIINVHQVKGRGYTDAARMELAIDKDLIPLGTVKLPFKFRAAYMGKFAFHFTKREDTSIIYCNEPGAADRVALEIADEIQEESDDSELTDLATFLRQEIHPQYLLASLVRKGVAFHYGNIPQIIRGRLEELLRDRKLRFVCCTSTLLQGINLPAKNIFVEDPKKGRGSAMKKGDFWNLVGRAGRLSKEFCGNVFCIFGKKWDSGVTTDRLASIESAFEVAVNERTGELLQFVKELPESSESRELSWAEQAYSRIYADFVSSGKRLADSTEGETKPQLEQIDLLSAEFKRTLTDEIFLNNFYVHPARLEFLAAFLRTRADLLSWIPINPYASGSYDRIVAIFQMFEELLIRSHTEQYRYHAFLAVSWMRGSSLRELVANKVERAHAGTDIHKINVAIRELFEDLESELRFKYVKYMRIYSEVLRAVLVEKGLSDEANGLLPIHLFLEYGAANQTLISLMAIGMSRTSAMLFKSYLSLRDDVSASECRGYLDRINIERTSLPAICKSEINRLRRIKA
jgi:replicative superfamily II helicase